MTKLLLLDEIETQSALRERVAGGAVSIGNFDGVHQGHRELLGEVRKAAELVNRPSVVVVLDPHPAVVLRPHGAPPRLTAVQRRAELMTGLGIDYLIVCRTTIDFLNRTAEEFFGYLICRNLRAKAMVEGKNFFFGRDRGGDVNKLTSLCAAAEVELKIVEPQLDADRMISSSRIREAISAGQIGRANEMLGSTYRLTGQVVEGERRGRTLGFPTANLAEIETLLPGHGVYAGLARLANSDDSSPVREAAIHIGPNPTFDDQTATKVEVHLLDYDGDLYGQALTVDVVDQVREVQRFSDAGELVAQLNKDITAVRQIIQRSPSPN